MDDAVVEEAAVVFAQLVRRGSTIGLTGGDEDIEAFDLGTGATSLFSAKGNYGFDLFLCTAGSAPGPSPDGALPVPPGRRGDRRPAPL